MNKEKEKRERKIGDIICSNHNFILVKSETISNIYKCTKCGYKERRIKDESKSNK